MKYQKKPAVIETTTGCPLRERIQELADNQQTWIDAGRSGQAISRDAVRDTLRRALSEHPCRAETTTATADHAAIRARLDAANDDIGIAYSIPADEWVLTCDKPTMVFLRYAQDDMAALFEEIDRLDRNDRLWHEWFYKALDPYPLG